MGKSLSLGSLFRSQGVERAAQETGREKEKQESLAPGRRVQSGGVRSALPEAALGQAQMKAENRPLDLAVWMPLMISTRAVSRGVGWGTK